MERFLLNSTSNIIYFVLQTDIDKGVLLVDAHLDKQKRRKGSSLAQVEPDDSLEVQVREGLNFKLTCHFQSILRTYKSRGQTLTEITLQNGHGIKK